MQKKKKTPAMQQFDGHPEPVKDETHATLLGHSLRSPGDYLRLPG
jgi:hypothetical protein